MEATPVYDRQGGKDWVNMAEICMCGCVSPISDWQVRPERKRNEDILGRYRGDSNSQLGPIRGIVPRDSAKSSVSLSQI